MKDIPFFQWEGCVATLALSEIPYRQKAYILVRLCPDEKLRPFIAECAAFCRVAGAKEIYASAEPAPAWLPHAYDLVQYICPAEQLQPIGKTAVLTPLDTDNQSRFLQVQRACFCQVDGAATYDWQDCKRMLQTHSGYLWLEGETVIGIGEIRGNEICTVAVTRQGCGEAMVRALVERIEGQSVVVQTASTNLRAIRLYERLGFRRTKTVSNWYSAKRLRE